MTQTQSTDRAIILQAMVSVAAADGDLHENELATIRTVYEQITGEVVSADDINSAHGSHRSQSLTFTEQLALERDRLTRGASPSGRNMLHRLPMSIRSAYLSRTPRLFMMSRSRISEGVDCG